MEIQAQTVPSMNTASAYGASNASSNPAANDSGSGSFTAALQGLSASSSEQEGQSGNGTVNGLAALIQLVTPIVSASGLTEGQATQQTIEQLDRVIQVLEQNSDPEKIDAMLQNPDLQNWLAQLQSLLVNMDSPNRLENTAEPGQEANGEAGAEDVMYSGEFMQALFIPLTVSTQRAASEETNSETAVNPLPMLSSAQVLELLTQLKDKLAVTGGKEPGIQQILKDIPAVIGSAAASLQEIHKPLSDSPNPTGRDAVNKPADEVMIKQAQPTVSHLQKLEALASKNQALILTEEPSLQEDAPLFQPLQPEENLDILEQPMTVGDFAKSVQNGQQVPKTVTLQMPASTFSKDLTQFVVSSFVLGKTSEGFTEAKISLYPQHLGHVEVKLTMQNGHLIAQFMADTVNGKEMLESQMSQLRTTLQSQGIQVDKLEVSQGQSYQSGMFQEGRQQQSQQSSKQNKSGSGKANAMDTLGDVEETTMSGVDLQAVDSSIDFTA